MNGLLLTKKYKLNTKFIILNNNGGGIFSNLDIKKLNYPKFKEYWTTPLNLELEKIANLYEIEYRDAENSDEVLSAIDSKKAMIIDYKIDIEKSKKIKTDIKNLIDKLN